jgi:hypothetical protein
MPAKRLREARKRLLFHSVAGAPKAEFTAR